MSAVRTIGDLFFQNRRDETFFVQLLDKLRGYELGGIGSLCFEVLRPIPPTFIEDPVVRRSAPPPPSRADRRRPRAARGHAIRGCRP